MRSRHPPARPASHRDAVLAAAAHLTGDIEQVPSAVSAIKVNGRARLRPGAQRGGGRARAPDRSPSSRFVVGDVRAGRRRRHPGARRRRRGHRLVGHLRARPGARPRRGAALRRSPHGLATHPGRRLRDRRRPPARRPRAPGRASGCRSRPLAEAARAAFAVREVDEAQARTLRLRSAPRRRPCRGAPSRSRRSGPTAPSWRCSTSRVPRHAASSCLPRRVRRVVPVHRWTDPSRDA